MNDDERSALDAWTEKLKDALNLNDVELDIDRILGLAGEAARAVVRPAAPVTTFLVGFAAGVAIGNGSAPDSAIAGAMETATRSARAQ